MKPLLLVDDNKKYADLLREYFVPRGYEIDEAESAAEGLARFEEKGPDYYQVIVTDITMETQLSGIYMVSKMHKLGFKGTMVVASTGFDVPTVVTLSRLLLRTKGVDYLVRKTTVIKKEIEFWPISFFESPRKEFQEITPTA